MVLWKYIELYRRSIDPNEQRVFIGLNGEALSCSGIHWVIKRLQSRAELGDIQVHAHVFRHTFAKFSPVSLVHVIETGRKRKK
jgi:site-specific recombinase XerD